MRRRRLCTPVLRTRDARLTCHSIGGLIRILVQRAFVCCSRIHFSHQNCSLARESEESLSGVGSELGMGSPWSACMVESHQSTAATPPTLVIGRATIELSDSLQPQGPRKILLQYQAFATVPTTAMPLACLDLMS